MDSRVRTETRVLEEVRTENSDETAVCRSRDRSLDRREEEEEGLSPAEPWEEVAYA